MTRVHGSLWTALALLAACGGETKTEPPAPSGENQALQAPSPGAEPKAAPSPQPAAEPKPTPAPAPSPGAAPPAPKLAADSQCAAICTRSTALGCPAAARCEAMCSEAMRGATCQAEMRAVNECMIAQPPANWECTDDGIAAIKDGFCQAEQAAVAQCLTREGG
jgi:hypothetical protein